MFNGVQLHSPYLQHNKHNEYMFEQIISIIAPHSCLQCGAEGSLLCYQCAGSVPRHASCCYRCSDQCDAQGCCVRCVTNSPFRGVHAVTTYEGVAKQLVGRLKFHRAAVAAKPMALLMHEALPIFPSHALVVPAPTATARVRARGYDQAVVLAKEFARLRGLHYTPLLRRMGQKRQVGGSREERQLHAQEMFWTPSSLQNKAAIIVDDVITTGSTLDAAAVVLRAAGATQLYAAVFAAA